MKIKDTVTLGTIAGIIGTIPQLLFHLIFTQVGFIKYFAFQLTGSVYMVKELTYTPLGLFIGGFVWLLLGGIIGVITAYLLILTGKDNWWLKGLLVNEGVMFLGVYGIIYTLGGAKIVPFDIKTNLIVLLGSLIYGVTMPYLIIRWRDQEEINLN